MDDDSFGFDDESTSKDQDQQCMQQNTVELDDFDNAEPSAESETEEENPTAVQSDEQVACGILNGGPGSDASQFEEEHERSPVVQSHECATQSMNLDDTAENSQDGGFSVADQHDDQQNFLDLYLPFTKFQVSPQEVIQFYLNFADQASFREENDIFMLVLQPEKRRQYLGIKQKLFNLYNYAQQFQLFSQQVNLDDSCIAVLVMVKLQVKVFQTLGITDYSTPYYSLPTLTMQLVPIVQQVIRKNSDKIARLNGNYSTPFDVELDLLDIRDGDIEKLITRKVAVENAPKNKFKLLDAVGLQECLNVDKEQLDEFQRKLCYSTNMTEVQIKQLGLQQRLRLSGLQCADDQDWQQPCQSSKKGSSKVVFDKVYYNSQDTPEGKRQKGFKHYLEEKEDRRLYNRVYKEMAADERQALKKRTLNQLHDAIQYRFLREKRSAMYSNIK